MMEGAGRRDGMHEVGGMSGVSRINGQSLGRKGAQTRRRLLSIGEEMLADTLPFALTPVAVCRRAGLTSAAFYAYFPDIADLLFALAEEVTTKIEAMDLSYLEAPASLETALGRLIDEVYAVHRDHHGVLRYRNVMSEHGEPRFLQLRTRASVPRIRVIERLLTMHDNGSASDEPNSRLADAVFINAGIESLSMFAQQPFEKGQVLSWPKLKKAQVRSITTLINKNKGPQF